MRAEVALGLEGIDEQLTFTGRSTSLRLARAGWIGPSLWACVEPVSEIGAVLLGRAAVVVMRSHQTA